MSENQPSDKKKLPLFHLSDRYPDIKSLWSISLPKAEIFEKDAIFVLDTNVLLLPYKTSKESLEKIRDVYSKLINSNRLFVPDQAIRELIGNKFKVVEDVYKSLSSAKDSAKLLQLEGIPLIKSMEQYQVLNSLKTEINNQLKNYSETIEGILQDIISWEHNDPISQIYKELFTEAVIVDCGLDRATIEKDFRHRSSNKIPPGYSDSTKEDFGIGDVIIWLTIIELGKKHKKPLIFVTSEKKPDWWEKFNKIPIAPRLELIDEYKRNSEQNSFSIIELSELLETFDVNEKVIEEVKTEEKHLFTVNEMRQLFENQTQYWDTGFNFPIQTQPITQDRYLDLKEVTFRAALNKKGDFVAVDAIETAMSRIFPRATLTKEGETEDSIYKLNFNGAPMTSEMFRGRLVHLSNQGVDIAVLDYKYI